MEKILTVNDVAAILQVKAITVREMFRENRLRGFKVGKAWRTTQQMLQDDIQALVRGELPAAPKAAEEAPTNGAHATAKKPRAAKAKAAAEGAPASPKRAPKAAAAPKAEGEAAPENGARHIEVKDEPEIEDTQQLLF